MTHPHAQQPTTTADAPPPASTPRAAPETSSAAKPAPVAAKRPGGECRPLRAKFADLAAVGADWKAIKNEGDWAIEKSLRRVIFSAMQHSRMSFAECSYAVENAGGGRVLFLQASHVATKKKLSFVGYLLRVWEDVEKDIDEEEPTDFGADADDVIPLLLELIADADSLFSVVEREIMSLAVEGCIENGVGVATTVCLPRDATMKILRKRLGGCGRPRWDTAMKNLNTKKLLVLAERGWSAENPKNRAANSYRLPTVAVVRRILDNPSDPRPTVDEAAMVLGNLQDGPRLPDDEAERLVRLVERASNTKFERVDTGQPAVSERSVLGFAGDDSAGSPEVSEVDAIMKYEQKGDEHV